MHARAAAQPFERHGWALGWLACATGWVGGWLAGCLAEWLPGWVAAWVGGWVVVRGCLAAVLSPTAATRRSVAVWWAGWAVLIPLPVQLY